MDRQRQAGDAVAALKGSIDEIDRIIASLARSASEASHRKALADTGEPAVAAESLRDMEEKWRVACRMLAHEVGSIAADIDAAMPPADEPQATGPGAWLRRMLDRLPVWQNRTDGGRSTLSSVLSGIDELYGLLGERRASLLAERHAVEADLVDLAGHRQALVYALADMPDAAQRVADHLAVFQDLVDALNGQVRQTNALVDKLAIEAERAILVAHLLPSGAGDAQDPASLPHLAPFLALQEKDLLSSIEIDRRRTNVDMRFRESFESVLDKAPSAHYVKTQRTGVRHA